jgi:hypothetical protein
MRKRDILRLIIVLTFYIVVFNKLFLDIYAP